MANTTIELSSDEEKLWRGLQRLITQQNQMDEKFRKIHQSGQAAGKSLADSFGSKMTSSLASTIRGYVSLASAVNIVTDALRFQKEEQQQATEGMRNLLDPNRALAQVARGDEDLQALLKQADAIAQTRGVDRAAARRLVFSARSEGFEGALGEIAKNAIVIDPEAQGIVAGQVPSLFKGKISSTEAINATLVAAEASRLNFESLARALPTAAQGAAPSGSSPAETLSLLSVLASRFKSGDEAATAIKGFGAKVAIDPELAGKGIVGAFRELQKMPESAREEFLKENEQLNSVYAILTEEVGTVEERAARIAEEIRIAGTDASLIAKKRATAQKEFGSIQRIEASRQAVEITRESRARRAAEVESYFNEALADLRRTDASGFSLYAAYGTTGTARMFFGDRYTEEQAREAVIDAATPFGIGSGHLREQMNDARAARLRETQGVSGEAVDALNQAAKNLQDITAEMKKQAKAKPIAPAAPRTRSNPTAQRELNSVPQE